MAETLIFPIGHYQGKIRRGTDLVQEIRLGASLLTLTDEEHRVWLAMHDRDGGQAVRAAESGVVSSLLERGILFKVAENPSAQRTFALKHRLVPSMLGLGNTPEVPTAYSIGTIGDPAVELPAPLYDLWEWGHMDPNLWVAVRGATATAQRVGIDNPAESVPELLLRRLLAALHDILAEHAAYLDRGLRE
ncbi:hypothetical protein [Saccharopolyspora phatthalungensis]|uniref:Uncharacterized protein n=1 Tax=Saccharopolyspora phatthalungensis TaxID=664693 RepID=A0A840QFX3_9PSEU|nr:hypothetical protein [Saccharopolyspora phatthalungensis]MBB5159346.1 hypothetical protein [Saccharopolyspora phatthalungensis]